MRGPLACPKKLMTLLLDTEEWPFDGRHHFQSRTCWRGAEDIPMLKDLPQGLRVKLHQEHLGSMWGSYFIDLG